MNLNGADKLVIVGVQKDATGEIINFKVVKYINGLSKLEEDTLHYRIFIGFVNAGYQFKTGIYKDGKLKIGSCVFLLRDPRGDFRVCSPSDEEDELNVDNLPEF